MPKKKYILNKCDMVLVKKIHTNQDRHLFYMVEGPKICVNINIGEEYYDFWCSNKKWSGPDGDNKFHEKDMFLNEQGAIKLETNSWLRMRWWLIKYYYQNIGRWKELYKFYQRRRKLRRSLKKKSK